MRGGLKSGSLTPCAPQECNPRPVRGNSHGAGHRDAGGRRHNPCLNTRVQSMARPKSTLAVDHHELRPRGSVCVRAPSKEKGARTSTGGSRIEKGHCVCACVRPNPPAFVEPAQPGDSEEFCPPRALPPAD